MSPHSHLDHHSPAFPIVLPLALLFAAYQYLRGWLLLRSNPSSVIPPRRSASFFLGLILIWTASGSPLAAYDHTLLTFHMIKHLLLMTIAPTLILLGEPLRVLWIATPLFVHQPLRRVLRQPSLRRVARALTNPALCWTVSALTLLAWHVPAIFALSMESESWHVIEQLSFFSAGILFWWPLIHPWPSLTTGPRWWMLLYLFLESLPCDILSGFLVFSDRVAYPMYFSTPRLFGFSVLADQQCAAALMWTCVTLIYLVPAAILCFKLLAPRASRKDNLPHSQFSGARAPTLH
jgi:putative membrane protein